MAQHLLLIQWFFSMSDIVNTNIRGLDFSLLLALDALYEERSVTRAAERLALTQSTVSGMLNRLRDLLDDELYLRTLMLHQACLLNTVSAS